MRLRLTQESRLWPSAFTGQLVYVAPDAEGFNPLEDATIQKIDDHQEGLVPMFSMIPDPIPDDNPIGGHTLHSAPILGHFLGLHTANFRRGRVHQENASAHK